MKLDELFMITLVIASSMFIGFAVGVKMGAADVCEKAGYIAHGTDCVVKAEIRPAK